MSGGGGGGGVGWLTGIGVGDCEGVCDGSCVCCWLGGLVDGVCAEVTAGQETRLTASRRAKRNCEDLRIMPTSRVQN